MSAIWNPQPAPFFTTSGQFAGGACAYFYSGTSTTPLTVYQDTGLTIPHAIPVIASIIGVFPPIYVPYGTYSVRVTDDNGTMLYFASGIDNPAPPSSGGGVTVTSDQIYQTGDTVWRMRTGAMTGFVQMNGLTIGSISSGASQYAAADAQSLFQFLWTYLPNSIAPVSAGRGASAAADWAANKTIVVPTMQGYSPMGVDDMGTTPAGRIQAITTCTPTGASAIVPVASATGIVQGQSVWINGVSAGTVTDINGLNITLSVIPAAGANVSWRSSFFSDADQIGASAGVASLTMTTDQLPSHNHSITDPGHSHGLSFVNAYGAGANGAVQGGGGAGNTAANTTGITIASTGRGLPANIIQPSRLGTYYMKL